MFPAVIKRDINLKWVKHLILKSWGILCICSSSDFDVALMGTKEAFVFLVKKFIEPAWDQCYTFIKTNQLNCTANQLNVFYVGGIVVLIG